MTDYTECELRLKHPFSMVVSGPSQAGKSHFTLKLINNVEQIMTTIPEKVYWCYTEWQPMYLKMPAYVTLMEGLPDLDMLKNEKKPQLVILDDLMVESSKTPALTMLFTRGVHHWNLSAIHIVQNTFYSNLRNARINSSYLVLFKNPADRLTVANLGRQLYPGQGQYFMQAFNDATSKPFGYLLVDLTQTTEDRLRLRTSIFPGELCITYLRKV